MAKKRDKKYQPPLGKIMTGTIHKAKRPRDHVAQEYADKGDHATAHELTRVLRPKAKRGVASGSW